MKNLSIFAWLCPETEVGRTSLGSTFLAGHSVESRAGFGLSDPLEELATFNFIPLFQDFETCSRA